MFQLFVDNVKEKVRWAYLNTVHTVRALLFIFILPSLN